MIIIAYVAYILRISSLNRKFIHLKIFKAYQGYKYTFDIYLNLIRDKIEYARYI